MKVRRDVDDRAIHENSCLDAFRRAVTQQLIRVCHGGHYRQVVATGYHARMATVVHESESARIHRQLDHPVIDGDGHWLEPIPVLEEFIDVVGGTHAVDRFRAWCLAKKQVYALAAEVKKRRRIARSNWWGASNKAIDRATSLAPALMNERLAEFGIDFSVIYPTLGLQMVHIENDELRHWCVRAYNLMTAEMFGPFAERMAAVALVPNVTPREALEELDAIA